MTEGNVNGVTEKEKNKNRVDRVTVEKRMRPSGNQVTLTSPSTPCPRQVAAPTRRWQRAYLLRRWTKKEREREREKKRNICDSWVKYGYHTKKTAKKGKLWTEGSSWFTFTFRCSISGGRECVFINLAWGTEYLVMVRSPAHQAVTWMRAST